MGIFWVLVFASIRTSLSLENSWYPPGCYINQFKKARHFQIDKPKCQKQRIYREEDSTYSTD